MKVLVAGGAGYIGSTVTADLLEHGHTVTVYDSLIKGHQAAIPEQASFVQGDIRDRDKLDSVLSKGFDAIIHFAAFIEAGESMQKPGMFFENNVSGSINLIKTAVANGVNKIVFSSSAGVYQSKDTLLVEEDPLGAASVYGHTKRMIEDVLGWFNVVHGLRFAALRYFNAAGATPPVRGEAHKPETHLIPLVLQVPLGQREQIYIYGDDYPTRDGTCVRDYVHVRDLSSAHLLSLDALDTEHTIICNLGNGEGYSVKEVIDTAREVTGHDIPAKVTPRRPGDGASLVANAARAKSVLGWQPKITSMKDIVASAWEWHKTHPDGYSV